eukprot:TRINITY_DN20162_c0_g1_i1.p1 TRINITY_DN20162_c0_g1~~TRINITY_DN20162_c0_g1_i1.p1  ORF type:complete len:167 (+),score=12.38 TRINITY_DN20162_c0_g1_i1:46-546(+)
MPRNGGWCAAYHQQEHRPSRVGFPPGINNLPIPRYFVESSSTGSALKALRERGNEIIAQQGAHFIPRLQQGSSSSGSGNGAQGYLPQGAPSEVRCESLQYTGFRTAEPSISHRYNAFVKDIQPKYDPETYRQLVAQIPAMRPGLAMSKESRFQCRNSTGYLVVFHL